VVVARRQIAEVLVRSLAVAAARGKTLELVAGTGPATIDFEGFFDPLQPDRDGSLDGVRDTNNMALADEPARVRDDLDKISTRHNST
jgi:hypothetical protein